MSTPLKDFNSCMNATPTKQSATIQVILVSGDLYKNATFRSKLKKTFLKNYSIYKPLDDNCNKQNINIKKKKKLIATYSNILEKINETIYEK